MDQSEGCQLLAILARIFRCPGPRPITTTILLRLGPVRARTSTLPQKGDPMADPVHIQADQEFLATISGILDAEGNPTTLDGVPTWESSDETLVDLRVAADGLSAIVGSFTGQGGATVTVRADGRHGPDVVELIGVLSVIVAPADAVVFDFDVGPVTDRVA